MLRELRVLLRAAGGRARVRGVLQVRDEAHARQRLRRGAHTTAAAATAELEAHGQALVGVGNGLAVPVASRQATQQRYGTVKPCTYVCNDAEPRTAHATHWCSRLVMVRLSSGRTPSSPSTGGSTSNRTSRNELRGMTADSHRMRSTPPLCSGWNEPSTTAPIGASALVRVS